MNDMNDKETIMNKLIDWQEKYDVGVSDDQLGEILELINQEIDLAVQEKDNEVFNKCMNISDEYGLISINQLLGIIQGREEEKVDWSKNTVQEERERSNKKALRLYDENYHHGEQKDGSKTFITEKEFDKIIKAINQQ